MQFRRFGKTDLMTSVFTFGAMRIPGVEDDEAVETTLKALDWGINHLETARGYGRSEEQMGMAMPHISRDEVIITTKIGLTDTPDEMRRCIDESLTRMNVDRIDNFDIHGINTHDILDKTLMPGGCLDAVRQAMTEGIIDHLGFSTHGPLDVILRTLDTDEFESVNLHYYYFNQWNGPAVVRANEKDMGVFIISPTDKGGQLFNPPPKLEKMTAPFTPIGFNHRFLLANEMIHTVSLGAGHPHEYEPHMAVVDLEGPLTDDESQILAGMDAEFHNVLGDTWCSLCHDCLPCPEKINIPEVLRLRSMTRSFDMIDFGKYRYNLFEAGGHWHPGEKATACTDCGDCLARCPEKLDIPALLRDTHDLLLGEQEEHMYATND